MLFGIPWQESNKTIFKGKYVLLHVNKVKPSTAGKYSCIRAYLPRGKKILKFSCHNVPLKGQFWWDMWKQIPVRHKHRNLTPKATKSGHSCFSVVKWLNFPFKGKHLDITTKPTVPLLFLFWIISLNVNIRPLGNWELPSSTWRLWLIVSDLFFFFSELNAFMTRK